MHTSKFASPFSGYARDYYVVTMWRPIDMTTFGSNIPKLEFPTIGNDAEHRGRAKVKTNSAYLKHSDRTWITLTERYIAYYYHPPTKLWEGNVFSHACLSTKGPDVAITHDAVDLTIQGPFPGPDPLPDNSFCTWDLAVQPPC